MKTYQFRDALIAGGLVAVYLCVFIYGCIWLERETDVNTRLSKMHSRLKLEQISIKKEMDLNIKRLESRIMPSAFIGQKTPLDILK